MKYHQKIDFNYIADQFDRQVNAYKKLTVEVGLWNSERSIFENYIDKNSTILDLGCGTGRTTFGLYELGYRNIQGIDLSNSMINCAKNINIRPEIKFQVANATSLPFTDSHFDCVFFSFNGLMYIPSIKERIKAVNEIKRIIRPGGIFIFTTHSRNSNATYKELWLDQKITWEIGNQNERLYDFGDLILENSLKEYIHIPSEEEVYMLLDVCGFNIISSFYRNDRFAEKEKVIETSENCNFWITNKPSNNILYGDTK